MRQAARAVALKSRVRTACVAASLLLLVAGRTLAAGTTTPDTLAEARFSVEVRYLFLHGSRDVRLAVVLQDGEPWAEVQLDVPFRSRPSLERLPVRLHVASETGEALVLEAVFTDGTRMLRRPLPRLAAGRYVLSIGPADIDAGAASVSITPEGAVHLEVNLGGPHADPERKGVVSCASAAPCGRSSRE